MKKFFIIATILLLAAACAKPPVSVAPTPSPAPAPTVYETDYLKVTIPAGWTAVEANKRGIYGTRTPCTSTPPPEPGVDYYGGCKNGILYSSKSETLPNPAAVNITKGKYILYINTQASQASGVEGGRFAEIAMGAPSADAVVTDEPNQCGTGESHDALQGHPRVDLYVNAKDKQEWCKVPTNGKTVWFFSYIANQKVGGFFNYYNKDGSGPDGYVVTMAYNSKDVDNFPEKDSAELNSMLDEMTSIFKTLEIKPKAYN